MEFRVQFFKRLFHFHSHFIIFRLFTSFSMVYRCSVSCRRVIKDLNYFHSENCAFMKHILHRHVYCIKLDVIFSLYLGIYVWGIFSIFSIGIVIWITNKIEFFGSEKETSTKRNGRNNYDESFLMLILIILTFQTFNGFLRSFKNFRNIIKPSCGFKQAVYKRCLSETKSSVETKTGLFLFKKKNLKKILLPVSAYWTTKHEYT